MTTTCESYYGGKCDHCDRIAQGPVLTVAQIRALRESLTS
jgi:hypothetical protein